MSPDSDTLSNVSRFEYSTAHDQRMVESGVTEGRKNCFPRDLTLSVY